MKTSFSKSVALPFLLAASISAAKPAPDEQAAPAKHNGQANAAVPGTLNIIWHGAFLFVPTGDRMEILAPYVTDHVYRAGTFLEESDLAGNGEEYTLDIPGNPQTTADFSRSENVYVRGIPLEHSPRIHSKWVLPRPDEIHSMRCIRVAPSCFTGKDAPEYRHLKRLADVQVLTYRVDDLRSLSITRASGGSVPWLPRVKRAADDRSPANVNLHVFAVPATPFLGAGHVTMAFDALTQLVAGLDLRFRWDDRKKGVGLPVGLDPIVPGLEDSRELLSLVERSLSEQNLVAFDSQAESTACTMNRRSLPRAFNPLAALTSPNGLSFAEDSARSIIRACHPPYNCSCMVCAPRPEPRRPSPPPAPRQKPAPGR